MSLLGEIRGSVAPRDIDRFDDLVLKKEIEIMKVCNTVSTMYFVHEICELIFKKLIMEPILFNLQVFFCLYSKLTTFPFQSM